jgi:hypothetical protein
MAAWRRGWSESERASTAAYAESLDHAHCRSYEKFKTSLAVNGGGYVVRRACIAHRISTSVLLIGWLALADVPAPAHAIRSSVERSATAPLRDPKSFLAPPRGLKRFLSPPAHKTTLGDNMINVQRSGGRLLPLTILPHTPLPLLHSPFTRTAHTPFFRTRRRATFSAAVFLPDTSRCASQIPQILAWMRALGVPPRVRTLAYALVFWAEVSIGGPLLEQLRTFRDRWWGDDGGEYVRLVLWMEDWVGAENVPAEVAVGEAMR